MCKILQYRRRIVIFILIISFITLMLYDVLMRAAPRIDITKYPVSIDYGFLSEKQIQTFDDILEAVDNDVHVINCPEYSDQERHEIITQLGLYLGNIDRIEYLISWRNDSAILDLDLFEEYLKNKAIIDRRIDEAVSALREGSDRIKLYQISNYVSTKIMYTDGVRDTIDALNGKGVCSAYTMLFYKMATRLGIKAYTCYGYIDGVYHTWNMVELDGKYIHYDVTFYDYVVPDIVYLHIKHFLPIKFQVNNKWGADLD